MKKIVLFVFAVVLCICFFSGVSAYAEDEKHPIDSELEKRLEVADTTVDMMEAYAQTAADWDKLLNENYNALMETLSGEQQERLRASQREWIKFRDLEFEFNANFWDDLGGTMWGIFPYVFQSDFIRARALQLGALINPLEGLIE